MSANEMTTKIEELRELEELIEEAKAEAETLRDEIKAEMMERDIEELSVGHFVRRHSSFSFVFVLGLTTGGVEIGCPSLLFYYTTKFVVCQYAIRNFFYEKRNIFSFFVLLYYEKRDTIAKRKG